VAFGPGSRAAAPLSLKSATTVGSQNHEDINAQQRRRATHTRRAHENCACGSGGVVSRDSLSDVSSAAKRARSSAMRARATILPSGAVISLGASLPLSSSLHISQGRNKNARAL